MAAKNDEQKAKTNDGAGVVPTAGEGTPLRGLEGGAINRRADQPDVDETVPDRTVTAKTTNNDVVGLSQTMDDIENVMEPTPGQQGERETIVPFAGERVALELNDAERTEYEARVALNRRATEAGRRPADDKRKG